MKKYLFVVISLWCSVQIGLGQQEVWLTVERGTVLFLLPVKAEWIPVVRKEKIPVKSFILTKVKTEAQAFKGTDAYPLPSDAYFFLDDIFQRTRVEMVSSLTQIEAEQLPRQDHKSDSLHRKPVGLIYGNQYTKIVEENQLPYERERNNAIDWFLEQEQYSAALLSLKRFVSKYPQAYLNRNYVNKLMALYDKLELYGFLLEESRLLLRIQDPEYRELINHWHILARNKLMK